MHLKMSIQLQTTRNIDMRLAAYMVGVRKTAEASRFRGWAINHSIHDKRHLPVINGRCLLYFFQDR